MHYVIFDNSGMPLSAHADDTVLELPADSVEVNLDQFKRWFDLRLVDGNIQMATQSFDISVARLKKAQAIESTCAALITGGQTSAALGASHLYPTDIYDQSNLAANVISSFYTNLPVEWTTMQMCRDNAGNWAYRAHTAQQIQQVGSDVKDAILSLRVTNAQLQQQIANAQSAEELEEIVWPS